MIGKGEPWGHPARGAPDIEVHGDDRVLAAQVTATPGALVAFHPDAASDLARAVGIAPGGAATPGTELPMDVLALDDGSLAVNMVVLGTAPERLTRWSRAVDVRIRTDGVEWFSGRCTTIVLAVGQWRHGLDLVPRGHPGDGRFEVQAYALARPERRALRRRLRTGTHLPHPRIATRVVRAVEIWAARALPLEVDQAAEAPAQNLTAAVRPQAYRLLV